MNETTTNGCVFNLSGGEPIKLREMLSAIGERLGKRVKFLSVPFCLAYSGAWFVFIATLGKVDLREKVQRLCEPRVFSHSDATEAFGYCPMTFQQGSEEEITEYEKINKTDR